MKLKLKEKKYIFWDLLLISLILCLMIVISFGGLLNYFNWKIFDIIVNINRSSPEHRNNVVIVCIDQNSIDFFDKQTRNRWPWPREFHGQLVRYLTECGAKAIVFDIIFSEPDFDRANLSGEYSDNEFAAAIAESGIVYLSAMGQKELLTEVSIEDSSHYLKNTDLFQKLPDIPRYNFADFPILKFSKGARGIGLVNLDPEVDGIYRKYPLVSKIGDKYMPSLCFVVIKDIIEKEKLKRFISENIGKKGIVDREGKFLINWYGVGGTGRGAKNSNDVSDGVFNYYSYHAVIGSSIQEERGKVPVIPKKVFKDKIVVIGSNAPGLFDLKTTPFTYKNVYPGFEILATVFENMLSGDFIRSIQDWVLYICMIAISFVLFSFNKFSKKLSIFIVVYIIMIVGEIAISYFSFALYRNWLPPAEFLVTTTFIFVGLVVSGYVKEIKENRFIQGAFGKYLPPVVVDYLIENPEMLNQIEGERREMTVFFSDIVTFTTISEYLGPEKIVKLVNEYFEHMTEIIMSYRGTVDRFEGDAIMAFYGAPIQFDNHAELACLACLEMQEKLSVMREKWRQNNIPDIFSRMGVNSGPMMVGNMGSFSRKQYSVVGDAVNLASRLESLNKLYGTYMMIGEKTYEQTRHVIEARELDMVRVVGKTESVKVYELLSRKGELNTSLSRVKNLFTQGIACYRERKWDEAVADFNEVLNIIPDDGPSKSYISRCENFRKNPPLDNWDFISDIKTKG